MAKFNSSVGKAFGDKVAKKASDNTNASKISQKTIRLLYDAVHNFNRSQQEKSMRYLASRFVMGGESFGKSVNLAPIHELIIGIKLGVYKTPEDIDNNTAFGKRMNKGSDLKFKAGNGQDIYVQVKGEHGYIKISPNAKVVLKTNGVLDRAASLPSILEEYFKNGPTRMAFPMTYAGHSANAFFDVGKDTFKIMANKFPTWFNPTLEKKYMQVKTDDFQKEADRILKENNLTTEGFTSLQVVAGSELKPEQKLLLDMIKKFLLVQREKEWRQYGRIYIKMNASHQKILATDPSLGAIINTGIKRYEDHTPFYSILEDLFGNTNVHAYVNVSSNTAGNKSPKFYYNNSYQNINY